MSGISSKRMADSLRRLREREGRQTPSDLKREDRLRRERFKKDGVMDKAIEDLSNDAFKDANIEETW